MTGAPLKPAFHITPLAWMEEAGTRAVMAALGVDAARFVGGPVRDSLLGRPVVDIDIATSLSPDEAMGRLARAGITVAPTGLAHGTVTATVSPRRFEITTLRRDVETDGRHARVAFTDDWAADAARRDFTMNALFLDAAGDVFDAVGGLADLRAGHVRFVGDPRQRIREDVLRLLRFYRFQAQYGTAAADDDARAAARELRHLLPSLSAERLHAELLKLLAAADPVPTLTLMREDGVLAVVLPEAHAFDRLAALIAREPAPDALRRLAALTDAGAAPAIADRLKLSNADRDRLAAMGAPPWPFDPTGDDRVQRRALYHLGAALYRDLVLLTADAPALIALADGWQAPRFPLAGVDVIARGVPPSPAVGRLLAALETWWEEGDFRAERAACLAELDRRIASPDG